MAGPEDASAPRARASRRRTGRARAGRASPGGHAPRASCPGPRPVPPAGASGPRRRDTRRPRAWGGPRTAPRRRPSPRTPRPRACRRCRRRPSARTASASGGLETSSSVSVSSSAASSSMPWRNMIPPTSRRQVATADADDLRDAGAGAVEQHARLLRAGAGGGHDPDRPAAHDVREAEPDTAEHRGAALGPHDEPPALGAAPLERDLVLDRDMVGEQEDVHVAASARGAPRASAYSPGTEISATLPSSGRQRARRRRPRPRGTPPALTTAHARPRRAPRRRPVDGDDHVRRRGRDADAELRQARGWPVPITSSQARTPSRDAHALGDLHEAHAVDVAVAARHAVAGRHARDGPSSRHHPRAVLAVDGRAQPPRRGDHRVAAALDEAPRRLDLRAHAPGRELALGQRALGVGDRDPLELALPAGAVVDRHARHAGEQDQQVGADRQRQLGRAAVLVDDAPPCPRAPRSRARRRPRRR